MFKLPLVLFFATVIISSPLVPRTDPIACPTTPTFTYTNISYSSTLTSDCPGHINVVEAKITFNLANSAVSYLLFCEGVSNTRPIFFDGSQGYLCRHSDPSEIASMTYWEDGTQQINMQWACYEGYTLKKYMGVAKGKFDYQCNANNFQNPDWEEGEVYSDERIECTGTDMTLTPVVVPAFLGNGPGAGH